MDNNKEVQRSIGDANRIATSPTNSQGESGGHINAGRPPITKPRGSSSANNRTSNTSSMDSGVTGSPLTPVSPSGTPPKRPSSRTRILSLSSLDHTEEPITTDVVQEGQKPHRRHRHLHQSSSSRGSSEDDGASPPVSPKIAGEHIVDPAVDSAESSGSAPTQGSRSSSESNGTETGKIILSHRHARDGVDGGSGAHTYMYADVAPHIQLKEQPKQLVASQSSPNKAQRDTSPKEGRKIMKVSAAALARGNKFIWSGSNSSSSSKDTIKYGSTSPDGSVYVVGGNGAARSESHPPPLEAYECSKENEPSANLLYPSPTHSAESSATPSNSASASALGGAAGADQQSPHAPHETPAVQPEHTHHHTQALAYDAEPVENVSPVRNTVENVQERPVEVIHPTTTTTTETAVALEGHPIRAEETTPASRAISEPANVTTANPAISGNSYDSESRLQSTQEVEKKPQKLPGQVVPIQRATSILDLEVKVLSQPLGTENQWQDVGDGRVEFCGLTIRVISHSPSATIPPNGASNDADETPESMEAKEVAEAKAEMEAQNGKSASSKEAGSSNTNTTTSAQAQSSETASTGQGTTAGNGESGNSTSLSGAATTTISGGSSAARSGSASSSTTSSLGDLNSDGSESGNSTNDSPARKRSEPSPDNEVIHENRLHGSSETRSPNSPLNVDDLTTVFQAVDSVLKMDDPVLAANQNQAAAISPRPGSNSPATAAAQNGDNEDDHLEDPQLSPILASEGAFPETGLERGDSDTAIGGTAPRLDENHDSDDDEEDEDVEDESMGSESSDEIIMEDVINEDTPLVAQNCCIVWNSLDKHLSFCLMFTDEDSFAVACGALLTLQHKATNQIVLDVTPLCPASMENWSPSQGEPMPYSYYIHTQYNPPLGYIERYALSQCLIANGHTLKPALYATTEQCIALLCLATPDLLEHLMTDEVFDLLMKGLKCSSIPEKWSVPTGLGKLALPKFFNDLITKDLRLSYLKHEVLPHGVSNELLLSIDGLSHRLQNDALCSVLTDESLLAKAVEALLIQPPSIPSRPKANATGSTPSSHKERPSSSYSLSSEDGIATATSTSAAYSTAIENAKKAEQQVLVHLHFFRSLMSLAITTFAKDLIPPVISKIFQFHLLDALTLVAERFALPAGSMTAFIPPVPTSSHARTPSGFGVVRDRKGAVSPDLTPLTSSTRASSMATQSSTDDEDDLLDGRRASNSDRPATACTVGRRGGAGTVYAASYYSPAVEQELAALLDATIVRLNEKQEESVLNEILRIPVLEDPGKYNGLMSFMVRQLVTAGGASAVVVNSGGGTGKNSKRVVRECFGSVAGITNPFLLYHAMGLHEDEGSSSVERQLIPEAADKRNRFMTLVISQYLIPTCKGAITPVPPPPMGGLVLSKLSGANPMLQFQNLVPPQMQIPTGITSALIRVLEYTVMIASIENRELLLKVIFHKKSRVLQYIEACCTAVIANSKLVSPEVLCTNARFLRTVMLQMTPSNRRMEQNYSVFNGDLAFTFMTPQISKPTITLICRTLTTERNTLGLVLKAYNTIGGRRGRVLMYHSAVLALLKVVDAYQMPQPTESTHNTLRDVRDFLYSMHADELPPFFAKSFRESIAREVCARLGGQSGPQSPNASTSEISNASTPLSSSIKLRPTPTSLPQSVDELEAPPDAKALDDIAGTNKKLRAIISTMGSTPPQSPPTLAHASPGSNVFMSSPPQYAASSSPTRGENSRSPSPMDRIAGAAADATTTTTKPCAMKAPPTTTSNDGESRASVQSNTASSAAASNDQNSADAPPSESEPVVLPALVVKPSSGGVPEPVTGAITAAAGHEKLPHIE